MNIPAKIFWTCVVLLIEGWILTKNNPRATGLFKTQILIFEIIGSLGIPISAIWYIWSH